MNALLRAVVYAHLAMAGVHLWAAWVLYGMSDQMSHLGQIRKDDPHVHAKVRRYETVRKALAR